MTLTLRQVTIVVRDYDEAIARRESYGRRVSSRKSPCGAAALRA